MVVEMQLDNSWKGHTSSNVPSTNKIYKNKGYQGPSIVNEYDLQKEIVYNKKLPVPDDNNNDPSKTKNSYEDLVKKCHSEHFQGTKDENNYFRVITPVQRVIKGRIIVSGKGKGKSSKKEPDRVILETKKMFFKNFFQYLDYLAFKNGSRPREEFFSNEQDFQNAYSAWEKRTNKISHGFNGSNWDNYTSKNHGVIEYLNKCKEDQKEHREYVQARREELMKMKNVTHGEQDQNWTVASGRNCQKITPQRNQKNKSKNKSFNIDDKSKTSSNRDKSPERPQLLVSPALVKVVD